MSQAGRPLRAPDRWTSTRESGQSSPEHRERHTVPHEIRELGQTAANPHIAAVAIPRCQRLDSTVVNTCESDRAPDMRHHRVSATHSAARFLLARIVERHIGSYGTCCRGVLASLRLAKWPDARKPTSPCSFGPWEKAPAFTSDRPIAVICGDEVRSALVASILARSRPDERRVTGGMVDWNERGFAIERGQAA